jgi:hypothetical protein
MQANACNMPGAFVILNDWHAKGTHRIRCCHHIIAFQKASDFGCADREPTKNKRAV